MSEAKSSIEALLAMMRVTLTPEEMKIRQEKTLALHKQMDEEMIERHRCGDCGVDTINYSHSFRCPRRGGGY
jgi:hypothetical protein